MNKKSKRDLIKEVMRCPENSDIKSYVRAKRIVNTVLKSIVELTKDGDTMLVINNFGTFVRITRQPRNFVTPLGGKVSKGETKKLSFRSSKHLEHYYDESDSADED